MLSCVFCIIFSQQSFSTIFLCNHAIVENNVFSCVQGKCLERAGLGWAGLSCAVLGWAELCCAGLCCAVLGWAELCCAVLG